MGKRKTQDEQVNETTGETTEIATQHSIVNPRRWVIATYHRMGQERAEDPLPVFVNGAKALFRSGQPTLVPAFFVETARAGGIGGWDESGSKDNAQKAFRENNYYFEIRELPDEDNTPEGVSRLSKQFPLAVQAL